MLGYFGSQIYLMGKPVDIYPFALLGQHLLQVQLIVRESHNIVLNLVWCNMGGPLQKHITESA